MLLKGLGRVRRIGVESIEVDTEWIVVGGVEVSSSRTRKSVLEVDIGQKEQFSCLHAQ